ALGGSRYFSEAQATAPDLGRQLPPEAAELRCMVPTPALRAPFSLDEPGARRLAVTLSLAGPGESGAPRGATAAAGSLSLVLLPRAVRELDFLASPPELAVGARTQVEVSGALPLGSSARLQGAGLPMLNATRWTCDFETVRVRPAGGAAELLGGAVLRVRSPPRPPPLTGAGGLPELRPGPPGHTLLSASWARSAVVSGRGHVCAARVAGRSYVSEWLPEGATDCAVLLPRWERVAAAGTVSFGLAVNGDASTLEGAMQWLDFEPRPFPDVLHASPQVIAHPRLAWRSLGTAPSWRPSRVHLVGHGLLPPLPAQAYDCVFASPWVKAWVVPAEWLSSGLALCGRTPTAHELGGAGIVNFTAAVRLRVGGGGVASTQVALYYTDSLLETQATASPAWAFSDEGAELTITAVPGAAFRLGRRHRAAAVCLFGGGRGAAPVVYLTETRARCRVPPNVRAGRTELTIASGEDDLVAPVPVVLHPRFGVQADPAVVIGEVGHTIVLSAAGGAAVECPGVVLPSGPSGAA
ncbi:unnamed protein product, partial [Prorocentrum cordatum]